MTGETWEERGKREEELKRHFQIVIERTSRYLGWTFERSENGNECCYLKGNHDARLWFKLDAWHKGKERIGIAGLYPHSKDIFPKDHFSITVSASKTPEQIAKDIQNRLFPAYLKELEEFRSRLQQHNEYENRRRATIQKVADYFGVPIHENGSVYPKEIKPIYCICPFSDDKVKFELEVSAEQAIKVFELLKVE